jgi:hypothetical protein
MSKTKAEMLAEQQYSLDHCYTQDDVDYNLAARSCFIHGYGIGSIKWKKIINGLPPINSLLLNTIRENDLYFYHHVEPDITNYGYTHYILISDFYKLEKEK